jgi:hypothetical protein
MYAAYRKVPASTLVNVFPHSAGTNCVEVDASVPESFGPVAWNFLHTSAEFYAPTCDGDQAKCQSFLSSLPAMLPCKYCQKHMSEYLQDHDVADACVNTDSLRTWLVDFHNSVSRRTGSDARWTPEQAEEAYKKTRLCVSP